MNNYQKAIENSNIVSKTDIKGNITFVNEEFIKLFEYSNDELIGQNHNIIRHPDTPKENFKELWNTILNKRVHKATVKNLSKSGKTIYLNTTIIPILDENEDIFEFIAIRYDITNEVMLQKELEQNQKIIFLQSRMASLGQMLANIAHQWRQPLTELNLNLFNLKKTFNKKDTKEFEKLYENSKNLILGMSNTIENFTNFFTPQKEKEFFLLNLSINDALKILTRVLEDEQISIKFEIEKNLEIFGVKNELTQVLLNLINNSKDAFVTKNIEKKELKIRTYTKDNFIYLEYLDNAQGLNNELFDKIYEPYFTTKHKSSGTGLGLFICKIIIENSFGGEIMHKNIEQGLKFTIKFTKVNL
ncbi:PAS domain-containing sensor histidine kinase [Arcobacter vandammei]|uniref:PAS domain-containing sensor histidine kinase n=1 Tax=Arcobacter vandammei TaxID=2782243 RepID=UPI0018DF249B|nr:PAS domain S-box protein [Arcobacter vandammei]